MFARSVSALCTAPFVALLIAAAPNAAAAQAQTHESVDLPPEIERVLRDYEDGWNGQDAAALAGLFSPDGFVMSPNRPPVRGREAIQERYTGSGGGGLILRALDYAAEGNIGFIIGGYRYSDDGPDMGKFILALKRAADGTWQIAADMDNGNG